MRRTLDFDELPAGTIFNDTNQPYDNGHGVKIFSSDNESHPAIVFDSDKPTGNDPDLGTPNEDFGGPGKGRGGEEGEPGQNDKYLHEILIIADSVVDENGDGLVDDPNDFGAGGFINITFDQEVDIYNITFVDSDETESKSYIKTYDADGVLITNNSVPALGDNALYFVDIHAKGIRKLEVFYESSGAIGFFHFFRPETDMIDFFAYNNGSTGYVPNAAHDEAVNDGIWTGNDFFDTTFVMENETVGRDKNSLDADEPEDWQDHGGRHSAGETQGYRNFGHLVLNEILFDPEGDDEDGGEWVEIYNPTNITIDLDGYFISNRNLTHSITLPDWEIPPDSYLVVHVGGGTNDSSFADDDEDGYKEASCYPGLSEDFFDNDMDEVALYRKYTFGQENENNTTCENDMVDFIAYNNGTTGYVPGEAHDEAVEDGLWSEGDFFDSSQVAEGETIGRDMYSRDLDDAGDWDDDGGKDAGIITQGYQNIPEFSGVIAPAGIIMALFILAKRKRKKERLVEIKRREIRMRACEKVI